MYRKLKPRKKEEGAVVVTVALLLFLLLGFMGLALDFGHLFIIRTELQTSMDACALAASQELNGQPDAITRATSAGITAGNANAVDLQSANWKGKAMITAGEITFFDQAHNPDPTAANARYVRCTHTQPATSTPLIHMAGIATGSTAFAATMNVGTFAEATTTPVQSTCPVPLALYPKTGTTGPNYGFAIGEWVALLTKSNPNPGQIGWATLNGSSSATEIENEMNGPCVPTTVDKPLGTPGVKATISDTWNGRFGIYKNNSDPSANPPDFTGYVYTAKNYPQQANAYGDFLNQRQNFTACASSVANCETATGLSLNQFKTIVTPGPNGDFKRYGVNRRVVLVPVVDAGSRVVDFACMLMLQPIPSPLADVQLEFRGNASAVNSPCTSIGPPGGVAGPRVPVLVR